MSKNLDPAKPDNANSFWMTRAILDKTKTPFYRLSPEGRVEYVNQAACESLGYTQNELVGLYPWDFDPDFKPEYWPDVWNKLLKHEIVHIFTRHRRKDGTLIDVEVTGHYSSHGIEEFSFVFVQDITERKAAEDALRKKESYLRALIDNFPFMVWLKDRNSRFLTVNQILAQFHGYESPEQIAGKTDFDLSPPDLAEHYRDNDLSIMQSGQKEVIEEQHKGPKGRHWIETYKAPVIDVNGEVLGTVGFARDITDRKAIEEKMQHLAHYDALTDLPNRALLMDRLLFGIGHASRNKSLLCLMYVDLDRFKEVNDTLGHAMGDLLLKQVAERLLETLKRETDTVARIGGDEFIVLISNIHQHDDVIAIATSILGALNEKFILKGTPINISASIGIALYPTHAETPDSLMKVADGALYKAKEDGKNCFKFA